MMNRYLHRFLPRTFATRILAALILTLVVGQGATWVVSHAEFGIEAKRVQERSQGRISVAMIKVLAATPDPLERQILLARMQSVMPFLDVEPTTAVGHARHADHPSIGKVEDDLGPSFDVRTEFDEPLVQTSPTPIIITAADGSAYRMTLLFGALGKLSPVGYILSALSALALLVFLTWLARSLARRLGHMAKAAAEFDPEGRNTSFPVAGPLELQALAASFNRMKDRITALLHSQTLALAAVGHDLRTPVTRLRLRAEAISDPNLRESLLRDLGYMEAMIGDVLSLLQRETSQERAEPTDVAAILDTVCNDFSDMGNQVIYDGPDRLVLHGRSEDLLRMVTNLVANATRFSNEVRLTLSPSPDQRSCTIFVDDDGPGIPAQERAAMLEAFRQGSGTHVGGLGLGLYIADSMARAHGGGVTLDESPMGGLRARVEIRCLKSETATEPALPAHAERIRRTKIFSRLPIRSPSPAD